MHQSVNLIWKILGTGGLLLAIVISVVLAIGEENSNYSFIFVVLAALTLFGTASLILISYKNYGGIPLISPKNYIEKELTFCPIKAEEDSWIATLDNFNGQMIAVSTLDFIPKDKITIEQKLEESIEQEKRIKITSYGYKLRKGYVFLLIPESVSESGNPLDVT